MNNLIHRLDGAGGGVNRTSAPAGVAPGREQELQVQQYEDQLHEDLHGAVGGSSGDFVLSVDGWSFIAFTETLRGVNIT